MLEEGNNLIWVKSPRTEREKDLSDFTFTSRRSSANETQFIISGFASLLAVMHVNSNFVEKYSKYDSESWEILNSR